ncbi:hypothetical protein Ae201684P_007759 [Aphanomyces euteiches]|nr:hypothetical protein Ae201684P_007759 [Aphanomyces euteiches]
MERKSKHPIHLAALDEEDENDEPKAQDERQPVKLNSTATTTGAGKKRLQLTIKNVLMRAQVTKVLSQKNPTSVLPEAALPLNESVKLMQVSAQLPKLATPKPPPLTLNHTSSQTTNIWSNVVRKSTMQPNTEGSLQSANNDNEEYRKTSLRDILMSPKVKQYVNKVSTRSGSVKPLPQSAAMRHWSSSIGSRNNLPHEADDDHREASREAANEERKREASNPEYGRNLILAESCRAAFGRSAENRSNNDIQALKTWFQKTKLNTCTDFESLQTVELTLLCRRMKLHAYYANEVVFKQGEEGDALYIVFSGKVEVRVSQQVMGEFVEVVVCEIGKATIVTKVPTELVSICRDDYNVMLKEDQQAFLAKASIAPPNRLSEVVAGNHATYLKILKKKPSARSKADLVTLATFLQTLKFFRGLPKTFVQELCTIIDLINVDANTTIFREGEVGKLFYVILSGSVDVKINAPDKRGGSGQAKLVNLGEGSHFGDLALIKKDGLRSATVVATEQCELLIISEKDYNSILKKLQKEDMQKRMELLDRIPIFQSVEWTSELMEELSYVLIEQRCAANTTVFKQGDKATQIYFITRGEVVISRVVTDPKSHNKYSVVVARLGPFNVFGDDAATGKNFNEVVLRTDTATASTPIEVLILTKYDVFNRLSRMARETMRTHTHQNKQPIVVFDQLYKTLKWEEYKRKVVQKEANLDRLQRRLGQKHIPSLKAKTPSTNKADLPPTELVEGNELLLLSPLKAQATPPPTNTLAGYTLHYNPDISTPKRIGLLEQAVENDANTAIDVLNEGNPIVYLNYLAARNMPPADSMSENFVFSLPSVSKNRQTSPKKKGALEPSTSSPSKRESLPQLLQGGFVVINLSNKELNPRSKQPAFRVIGLYATHDQAVVAANHVEAFENAYAYRSLPFKHEHPVEFFIVETGRHVIVPTNTDHMLSTTYCDEKMQEYLHDHGSLDKLATKRSPERGPASALSADAVASIMTDICGYIEPLDLSHSPPNTTMQKEKLLNLQDIEHNHMAVELKQPYNFACVSTLVVGDGSEPTLCVFRCFPTEAEANDYAETGFPKELSAQALLCVVPMYEWIYFEDATDWCLQMRKSQDRHNLALHKKELHAIQKTAASPLAVAAAKFNEAPQWLIELEQGQRLHHLICSHMGVKEKESEKALDDEGYSQKSSVGLEQKLESLQDILNAKHQNAAYGTTLQKMQKVQRFGHIMKLRLHKE